MPPLRSALIAQLLGTLAFFAIAKLFSFSPFSLPLGWIFGQGACAALISYKLGAPRWWIPIHIAFLPLALTLNRADIPPFAWLGGFLLLFLLFWRTDKSRVPLFLTNARTAQAIAKALPEQPCRCIDLGCGTGSLLQRLALARPDCAFTGVEHAPIPFLIAWLRSKRLDNLTIRHGDFWKTDLRSYDVIYVFLSPVPMPRLWQKACNELPPDSLVISNSFIIPSVPANSEIAVPDRRRTRLYCYKTEPHK